MYETILNFLNYFFVFCFGAILGSFLNVLILRIHNDESWWSGRSHCPDCKKELEWYELVPVLSYILQGGKCRNCSKKLSIQYPIVEVASSLLAVFTYWKFGVSLESLLIFTTAWLLLGSFISDLRFMELPEIFSWSTFALGVIYQIIFSQTEVKNIIFGIVFGFLFFWIQFFLTKGQGLGEGDIRLGLIMGVFLAWPNVIYAIFASYIVATIILVPFMALKKIGRKTPVPLGVFLIPTFLIFLYYQKEIMIFIQSFYLNL